MHVGICVGMLFLYACFGVYTRSVGEQQVPQTLSEDSNSGPQGEDHLVATLSNDHCDSDDGVKIYIADREPIHTFTEC